MTGIKFGAFYPRTTEKTYPYKPNGGIGPREFAQRIEALGFDAFFTGESPINRGASYEQFAVLSYAAAATDTLRVGSDILLMPLHHPIWVAREWGTLDLLSNGRTILGVGGDGAGQGPKQFDGFGIPLSERGSRTDEGIEIVKKLWTEDNVSHHGKHFNFDGVTMEPKPLQPGGPPIWIGGRPGGTETGPDGQLRKKSATGAVRRTAVYGDVWHPFYMTPETYAQSVIDIKEHAALIGRDISDMGWSHNFHFLMDKDYETALDRAVGKARYGHQHERERIAKYDILGNPDDCIKRLQDFVDAGVNYFVCQWSCEPDEVMAHCELIAKEVMPHFQK